LKPKPLSTEKLLKTEDILDKEGIDPGEDADVKVRALYDLMSCIIEQDGKLASLEEYVAYIDTPIGRALSE